MNEYDLDILRLGGQGYCCAQIVVLLALEMQGVENFGLVRAMAGLWPWLVGVVLLQFTLGVLTVLTQVDITLGVVHQFGALLLLAVVIVALHRTGRAPAVS